VTPAIKPVQVEVREHDEDVHPQAMERETEARIKQLRAQQRLIGSYALGALGLWKLATVDDVWVWLGVVLIAFGLANVDQVLKAMGRG
jgi:hypothetical protein